MMEQDRKEYLDKDESEKMCSSKIGEAGEMCSPADTDTCGDGCSADEKSRSKSDYRKVVVSAMGLPGWNP
ncbi:MAG: hypothetical protein V8S08_01315 [Lachnoclostridium sp.]